MADEYSYPLLVELDKNNVERLKFKLTKYFQSKKANGGDCEVEHESGSRTAALRFRTQGDQMNVLGKATHEMTLSKGVTLKMTVRLPPDEKAAQESGSPDQLDKKLDVAEAKGRYDDDAEEEEPCSTSAVLGNIPETFDRMMLELVVEHILKNHDSPSDPPCFTLEIIPEISSTVVSFQGAKENLDFVRRCPESKTFTSKGLSVRLLEVTKQVAVEDIQNLNEGVLQLYFETEGGDVENVEINEEQQSAVITFKDDKAFQKVLKKKKHCIGEKKIRVFPFYKSLGTALYGQDRPSLNLPAPVSEPIDNAVWRYLKDSQSAAESIRSDLAKHFCDVNLHQSTVCLSPMPSLLKQMEAKAMVREWGETVKSAFAQAVSKYKSIKFRPESEVWEESEENFRQTLQNKGVVVVPDRTSGVLSVVGLEDDVNSLEDTLCEVIKEIVKRRQRAKSSITQVIKVPPSVFHLLCNDDLKEKLLGVYPELKMSFRTESSTLTVTGISEEILEAQRVICDATCSVKRSTLEMDTFVLDLLKGEEEGELTNALLTSNGINAAFEINAQKVQLLAFSDRDLNEATEHLQGLLISEYIDVEDCSILEKPEWMHLVSQVENAYSKPCRKLQIHTTDQQVVVCGHTDSVVKVSSELHQFLKQNAQVEEIIVVKPNTIVEYVKKRKSSSLEKVKGNVVVSFRNEAICLSGSRAEVTYCKSSVEVLVNSVICDSLKVSNPAVQTFFRENERMYVSSLLDETGCLVQLVDDTNGKQDQGPTPVYKVKTFNGVEIAVCKADMCTYPVDAVVNSSNKDLKHDGGLSAALLKAAGHQLQVECNKIIASMGQLKPGECVITDAGGQLCCKKIIHVVGPIFDPAASQKAVVQMKKAVRGSLELAERHRLSSVALPTISRVQGFPLDLCVTTIVKAVKEHCDECDDDDLRWIHLVDNDDTAVQAMEKALRREFKNDSASQSPCLQAKATRSPLKKPVGSSSADPNCLGHVKTKEGLDIILTKGKIQEAKTAVTVNTVSEDLALNKGAVSHAIFSVAGPQLQQLVNAKSAGGNVGEIIVTDGCKLKSKQVFHAVAPDWDNGQGTAEKTLSDIFKSCLETAEDTGLTSISFPAIGTGNLGFPKNLVASLLLKEISAFSSNKQPKHLNTVVIILYPQDAQTIQAFSDEFMNKFPSAPGGSVSPSSPQAQGHFSKVVSSSGAHETKIKGVVIQVATGDITKETSEVVVNSSNEAFSLKTGVSKAILDAAGQAVEAECQTLGAQANTGMILTQPGNLMCKKILHLAGQSDPVKIHNVVKDALQMCMKNSFTSVSFPAIGTGQGNVQARQVADAMFDAVTDVLSQNTSVSLKTIRIVIFQPQMLQDFHSSMLQREQREAPKLKDKGTNDKDNSWFWGSIRTIKSFIKGDGTGKQQNGGDLAPVEVEPTLFHICGDTKANVDSAKKWITDRITIDQTSHVISDPAVLSFSDADLQHIADIQKRVNITIDKVQATLTIEGFSKNVLKATSVITKMLKKMKDDEDLQKDVELVSTVADWQYQPQGSQFQSFDSMTNFQLEQAWQKNQPNVTVTVQGRNYTVALPKGPATDSQGNSLQIKRIDKLKGEEVPVHWDPMPPNTSSHAVTIKAGTPEYTEVLNLFQASCNRAVTKIERIQNPVLWKSLQIKKRDMEQRNGHQNNERRLFHGTCQTTIGTINELGFNRSYAGKNAARYGNGTYFAVQANYSAHDTYSKPNPNGEKCMYLCRVLTGDFTVGQPNMITPPAKGASSVQMYDSVVDKAVNPSMFVIFHDSQACPEYLITFK
ncbi:poly(ADP-ribose) polymerase family member 14-related sequence 1 [Solea solea]|uniref:poly(ADP-ribose) polymerase family member 14-related sequence 1 n=1 Tax=Solea solea TaxID=90069 RepID=UPI00272AD752|nr:poly(ADP-ribose) polymerase family member 14-related sequence 1 [Solea solea]